MHHSKNQENDLDEKRPLADPTTEMNQVVEVSDKDFKAAVIKMLQQRIANSLETNERREKSQQRNRGYKKKEPNGSYRTEKYNNRNLKKNS